MLQSQITSGVQTKTPPQSNECHPPRNKQARRRPVQSPEPNTRVYLNLVSKTFICQKLLYVAYVWIDVVVFIFISSVGQKFRRGGGRKGVLVAVEAVLAGSKPPATVGVRISAGERHGCGASAPLSTRVSSLHRKSWRFRYHDEAGQTRRTAIDPRRRAISVHHSICCRGALGALASLLVRFYVCLRGSRGCRASYSRPAKR